MNNVGYEFPEDDTRKAVMGVCKSQMVKYNMVINPKQKLAYGSSDQSAGTDAKMLLDLFVRDYVKGIAPARAALRVAMEGEDIGV
jgi:hypothetical protein